MKAACELRLFAEMPLGLTFFRTRRQIILKHADLRILRRIAAFLLVVLSIAGIAACTVPEEVFPPDTPTAAISDVLHTTEPTEIGTAAEIELSANFITKKQARELGRQGGGLQDFAPGCSIGGDRFGNYEGLLPQAEGRFYTECDIDTCGAPSRGAKRIVFSNDGLIFYTDDHYQSFIKLYDADN